jgi:hypothetical protein
MDMVYKERQYNKEAQNNRIERASTTKKCKKESYNKEDKKYRILFKVFNVIVKYPINKN